MNGETTDHNEVHIDTISGGNEIGQETSLFSVIRDDIDPNLVQTTDGNDHDNKDDHDGGVMNSKQAELSEHELLRMKEKKDQKPTNNDKNTEEWDKYNLRMKILSRCTSFGNQNQGEEETRRIDNGVVNYAHRNYINGNVMNIDNNDNEENHGNARSEPQINARNQMGHVAEVACFTASKYCIVGTCIFLPIILTLVLLS